MRTLRVLTILAVSALCASAPAAQYTVYPFGGPLEQGSGTTDYLSKASGEVLAYGGTSSGSPRKSCGWMKFDVGAVPDAAAVTSVVFHFYVNDTVRPSWSVTPVTSDPLSTDAATLWSDISAEASAGYYLYRSEGPGYAPGWKTYTLGGAIIGDVQSALASDWFALGVIDRDTSDTYYMEADGWNMTNVPYLVISDDPPPANDTCATATVIPVPGNSTYNDTTNGAADDYNCMAFCVGTLDHSGGDVVYEVTLPPGCEVCVTVNQSEIDWNTGVYMVTDCASVNTTCVAGSSEWVAGQDESFCYESIAGGTYYIIVDGRDGAAGDFRIDVVVTCLQEPSDLVCTNNGLTVQLDWVNNDVYDSIGVYVDGLLVDTLPGTDTTYTYTPDVSERGYLCFHVCGVAAPDSACSDTCCLIWGYGETALLWDFEADDGGFTQLGTGGWQWGVPTYGPCQGLAEGQVWATVLDADYANTACWVLDSPGIEMGPKGGFITFDHCYEVELSYDGTTVWFTTDDFWYYLFDPVEGYPTQNSGHVPHCVWVNNQPCFSGDSGGWITDCWDLSDPMWVDETVSLRLVLASDADTVFSGWMIDNVTVYRNVVGGTINCLFTCVPSTGTVPFGSFFDITLYNLEPLRPATRISARIDLALANGSSYSNWKSGTVNVAKGASFNKAWTQALPAAGAIIGTNYFTLKSWDVTPTPYNQPPYMPDGDSCTSQCVLVANAP